MSHENATWKTIGVFVTLATVVVPIYVTYDVYGRGSIPEKRLELTQLAPINPLRDLSALGERASFSATIEDQRINNLTIAQAWFENTGHAPVLPSEFYEHLSVSVESPWRIVTVENTPTFRGIKLRWKRVNDAEFEAEPALINPGDRIEARVYLTDSEFRGGDTDRKDPIVKWNTRIANLREFSTPPDPFTSRFADHWLPIRVSLSGNSLLFTVTCAVLFQLLYLRLLSTSGLLQMWGWRQILCVVGANLLAFGAAESSATYLFPDYMTTLFGVDHWLNVPWILGHVVVLIFLYRKSRASASGGGPAESKSKSDELL